MPHDMLVVFRSQKYTPHATMHGRSCILYPKQLNIHHYHYMWSSCSDRKWQRFHPGSKLTSCHSMDPMTQLIFKELCY